MEHSMEFVNRCGETIKIDPMSQVSIASAKAAAPGEGVGQAVSARLLEEVAAGALTASEQLPPDYRHLVKVCGLHA